MRTLATVCLLVAPAACLSGDFEVPEAAVIACDSDADCPEELVCVLTLGRCQSPTGDMAPPAFVPGTFAVDPLTANEDAVIEVEFTVNEELAAIPIVRLGNPGPEFTLAAGTPPEYVFQYTVLGTEAEDSISLQVELIDLAGNVATLGGLAVTLDFTDPTAVSPAIDDDTVDVGDTVTVTFTASETLGRTPDVVWMTTLPEAFEHDSEATDYTFTLDTTGLDPATANVQITLTDEAGNVSEQVIGPLTVQ